MSERRICRVLGQYRSTQRKVPRGANDEQALTEDIIALARQYGRYGYRRVTALLREAANGPLKGILGYEARPLVSVDFNHNPASSNFDATLTKVSGRLVKVSSWYDNEWGFSNRMLDTTVALMAAK